MKNYSIIIPIFNEENLLVSQVDRIINGIKKLNLKVKYEILLVENGSKDNTCRLAGQLQNKYKFVKRLCLPFPSYGQAFKEGLKKAVYPYIFQFDIDFWDLNFLVKAQKLLDKYDFIIGSKNLNHSADHRPLVRKLISKLLEKAINIRFKITISDTHGLKALKKSMADQFIDAVQCPNHFFDSELLIRAVNKGYTFTELPVNLEELRGSRFSFLVRVREVIKEFKSLISVQLGSKTVPALPYAFKLQKTIVNYIMQLFI